MSLRKRSTTKWKATERTCNTKPKCSQAPVLINFLAVINLPKLYPTENIFFCQNIKLYPSQMCETLPVSNESMKLSMTMYLKSFFLLYIKCQIQTFPLLKSSLLTFFLLRCRPRRTWDPSGCQHHPPEGASSTDSQAVRNGTACGHREHDAGRTA